MRAALDSLDVALATRWTRTTPWLTSGARARARAIDPNSGERLCVTAVACAGDARATASLAREIRVMQYLSHQTAVLRLHGAGRHDGWLYAVLPCTEGRSLAGLCRSEGPLAAWDVLQQVIVVADLLHFMHGVGFAHGAIDTDVLFRVDGRIVLGGFQSAVRLNTVRDPRPLVLADVQALARAATALLPDGDATEHWSLLSALRSVLHRASDRSAAECYPSAIAFAQALCAVRDAWDFSSACEVTGRDGDAGGHGDEATLSDGVQRSLSVLHALLDRAEVNEEPPALNDPLVQRCWDRASAHVSAADARLVALRVRWRLLADRDPAGALSASHGAPDAMAVWPYRARALAALGRAAEARTLAVRTWFDGAALDLSALRSLTIALVLTRAFELATLVDATACATGIADPVLGRVGQPAPNGDESAPRVLATIAAAIERRLPWTAQLLVDPRWDAVRGEPAFAALVGQVRERWTV